MKMSCKKEMQYHVYEDIFGVKARKLSEEG